jgi:conjugative relaxase-like TrwC/TraI family protein
MSARHTTRSAVAFIDATYSVPKSITVVHAAFEAQEVKARCEGDSVAAEFWAAHRRAVEAAIWAGNTAALEAYQDKAGYSRIGYHTSTSGRWIDAHRFVVASFFQHDSRDHDPQLHIHNAILNRVQCADGSWRTLDSKALHAVRREVAAIAERTTEEHLTRSLGLTFATRPDGKSREIVGIPQQVINLFSHRRRAISARTAQLVAAYRQRFDREPTALELDRLQRQATFATRRAKEHAADLEQRLDRWDWELRAEVAGGLAQVAEDVLRHRRAQPRSARISPSQVIAAALDRVQAKQSAWRRSDLVAEIALALPDHLSARTDNDVRTLLDGLADQALADEDHAREITAPEIADLPVELTLANGRSAYDPPSGPRYATLGHLRAEQALQESTIRRGAPALSADATRRYLDQLAAEGLELGADQRRAVEGVLTSGAMVESLVGPAGTGKSVVIGRLARAWQDRELWDGRLRRMYGLAASQIATDVLTGEGISARNVSRWLGSQERLEAGRSVADDACWLLAPADLVAVDESAMASTADVVRVAQYAERAGAKLLLTGDHRQLAAVGSGGAMSLASDAGITYELVDVRRFSASWERRAGARRRAPVLGVLGAPGLPAASGRGRRGPRGVPQARSHRRRRHHRGGTNRGCARLARRHARW